MKLALKLEPFGVRAVLVNRVIVDVADQNRAAIVRRKLGCLGKYPRPNRPPFYVVVQDWWE